MPEASSGNWMSLRRPVPRLSSAKTIARLADEGSDGRHWYRDAASTITDICAERSWNPKEFADVLAITSRRVQVQRNIEMTYHFMATREFHPVMMTGVKMSLIHWLNTGEIGGRKSRAFARAVLCDLNATVLDVWMARSFGIHQHELARSAVYLECSKRLIKASEMLDMKPAQAQASVWHTMIRRRNRTPRKFSEFAYQVAA